MKENFLRFNLEGEPEDEFEENEEEDEEDLGTCECNGCVCDAHATSSLIYKMKPSKTFRILSQIQLDNAERAIREKKRKIENYLRIKQQKRANSSAQE